MVTLRRTEHPPMYLWYPPHVPWYPSDVQWDPPMYWTPSDVLNTLYTGWLYCSQSDLQEKQGGGHPGQSYATFTLDQRFPYIESEKRDPLVACSEVFQMIGPIKLSHFTSGIWVWLAGLMNIVHKQHWNVQVVLMIKNIYTVQLWSIKFIPGKFRHEEQPCNTSNNSWMEQSLKLLNYTG